MTIHTPNHRSTAANDLVSYGTIGLELNRSVERREHELTRDRTGARIDRPSPVTNARQWIGDAIIRFGVFLAGERARRPRVATPATPKVDMA